MSAIQAPLDAVARVLRLVTAIVAACFVASLGAALAEYAFAVARGNGHLYEYLTDGIHYVPLFGFGAPFVALVAIVFVVPLHLLFRRREGHWRSLAGRATHVAAMASAGAMATFALASMSLSTTILTWDETVSGFAQSLPILLLLSVPVGLAFNYAMTAPARPFSLGRTARLPIWRIAFYAIPGYLASLHLGTHWAYDPEHARDAVVGG